MKTNEELYRDFMSRFDAKNPPHMRDAFMAGMEAAKKKNIVKWLESITEEQYRDCIIIHIECENCPAKEFCQADDSDKCCEEEFYKWSLLECEEEGGAE